MLPMSLTAEHAELSQIQTVYLLQMGNGFDQYLANRLTQLGPYRVVTDPELADAIFTDRLGKAFEMRFDELFGKPPAAAAPEVQPDEKTTGEPGKPATEAGKATTKVAEDSGRVVPPSSFGRGKGTVFLVARKSRGVVWSAFQNPRSTAPEVLDDAAERVVKQLKRDLAGK
jgi:hypothetical protein